MTLGETNVIMTAVLAKHLNMPTEMLAHYVAAERETIKQALLPRGKAQ